MIPESSPYKSKGGVGRVFNALRYSARGLSAAFQHEAAFRQELLLVVILVPVAFWIAQSPADIALLVAPLFLMLIVEVLNSAIEALADSITLDTHPLIGRAKDLGSAAVMLSIVFVVLVWAAFIAQRWA